MAQSETAKAVAEMQGREYDARVKAFLAEKAVLAQILKGCVEEFSDCTPEEIANKYIEGIPDVGKVRVDRDETNAVLSHGSKIEGGNSEDKTDTEGTVFYDIRFFAAAPDGDGLIRLIINVEAQKDADPGYSLTKRGIYYCSRMISAQKSREFTGSNYDDIRKVYSIWICYNSRKNQNTIVRYSIKSDKIVGDLAEDRKNYDLLQVIMIRLGDPDKVDHGSLLRFLGTVFSDDLKLQEKLNTLEDEYGIQKATVEKEMAQMCNISEGIFERAMSRGMEKGMAQGMAQGMAKGISQGEDKQARETAIAMSQAGFSVDLIARMVRRPEDVVLKWIQN